MTAAFLMIILQIQPAKSQSAGKKRRTLIIGMDGTAGHLLHRRVWQDNKAPAIRELMTLGKNAPCLHDQRDSCARAHSGPLNDTDFYWKTGPGWCSVITGADSLNHGVKYNGHEYLKAFSESAKNYPSLFKRAKEIGLKTAAGGVAHFITAHDEDGPEPGITDYECGALADGPNVNVDATESCNLNYRKSFIANDPERDNHLAAWLIDRMDDSSVDVLMGVFDRVDEVGHAKAFSPNKHYMGMITTVDGLIDRLIRKVKSRAAHENEEWLVVLTADHGGHRAFWRGDHGRFANQDNAVPFVLTLFGSDIQLADLQYPVSHLDVHPTVMRWFGLSSPQADGKVQGLQ